MTGVEIVVAKKIGTVVVKKFASKVVERWTRHRANEFFAGFVESLSAELKSDVESADTDAALEAILDDDRKSEVLWDAYRTVCLAKSKTLGPKIIGILAGQLVSEGRMANETEDQVFEAAEALSDGELIGIFKEYFKYAKQADACNDAKKEPHWRADSIVIPWSEETSGFGLSGTTEIDVSPLMFRDVFGNQWAAKAQRLGLLSSQTIYNQKDKYRSTATTSVCTIIFEAPCRKLCVLIERSLGAAQTGEKAGG